MDARRTNFTPADYTATMSSLLRFLLLSTLFLLLLHCDGKTRERRADRGDHYVSDPDHLFFMNTRSRDYHQTTPREGVDVFRHDDLPGPPELLIRNNWLEDRADLLLDGRILEPAEARALRDRLGSPRDTSAFRTDGARKAAAEVLADYLRLVGA